MTDTRAIFEDARTHWEGRNEAGRAPVAPRTHSVVCMYGPTAAMLGSWQCPNCGVALGPERKGGSLLPRYRPA
jgi:hypothetical protein